MTHLTYKGMRSTRFLLTMLILIVGSGFLGMDMVTQHTWVDLIKWVFGSYAASEAAAKGAQAYKKDA